MKKIIYLLSLIYLSSCGNINSQVIENIEPEEFKKRINSGPGIILDVRTANEFYSSHIQDASNIDFYSDDFIKKLKIVRKDVPIYVYCMSGGRSSAASSKMASLGFVKVYNLLGGIAAWNSENYITTRSKESATIKSPTFSIVEIENILKNNELVLIDFSTEWCVPCKKMKPVIQEIQKENINVTVLYIDADMHQELIKKYQIKGVPVFMIFKNGKEIFKHIGIISKEALLKQLN
jgi:thioredoxin